MLVVDDFPQKLFQTSEASKFIERRLCEQDAHLALYFHLMQQWLSLFAQCAVPIFKTLATAKTSESLSRLPRKFTGELPQTHHQAQE